MFRKLTEGIRYDGKSFIVDYLDNKDSDIIDICFPFIHQTKFDNLTYFFGYKFKENVPSSIRAKFLNWIKGLDKENIPTEYEIQTLVEPPISALNRLVNLSTFSCTLYPRSNRSNLTKIIQSSVVNIIPRMNIDSFELVKNIPSNIEFDWKKFNFEYDGEIGDHKYQQIKEYIERSLLPKIRSLEYFSLAENVKYKYRKYITNYLSFENQQEEDAFKALNGGNVLILDDINTSGSTLREILRCVRTLAPESNIFIFTLIGKENI